MYVIDLITELQKLPPHLIVAIDDDGAIFRHLRRVRLVTVAMDSHMIPPQGGKATKMDRREVQAVILD